MDEALDICEHHKLGLNTLRQTHAAIPDHICQRYPKQIEYIEAVIGKLKGLNRHPEIDKGRTKEFMIEDNNIDVAVDMVDINQPDLQPLIDDLKEIRFDIQIGKNDDHENRRLREQYTKRLKDLQSIYKSWRYFSKHDRDLSLNTARIIIPDGVKGAVVLDATADRNFVYQLHEDSEVEPIPKGSRDYSNVTLHISKGHSLGKWHMIKNAKQATSRLVSNLNKTLDKDRKAFVVCHKYVEPVLESYKPDFEMNLSHWGAFDGSNEYRDCDVAVIFGLKYMPKTWSSNLFMAFQGKQSTKWLQNPTGKDRQWGDYTDIRKALDRSALSVDIIQAINRIRCRKVVDAQGNCDPCDIYLMLPQGELAKQIMRDIMKSMPKIQLRSWNYDHNKKGVRRSNYEQALIKYIQNMGDGERRFSKDVLNTIGMSKATYERLIVKRNDLEADLAKAMKDNHVRYVIEGAGSRIRSFFIKD